MVIAIDGPAGSGKSTIASLLAERLKVDAGIEISYINSGNLYRAVTLGCLNEGIDPNNDDLVLAWAHKNFANGGLVYFGANVYISKQDVTPLLHSDRVDALVAKMSAIVPLRHEVNAYIKRISEGRNIVVEGRDMTTVVFPDADYRFYLDASAHERALRRKGQGVSSLSLEEIEKSIAERDTIDRNKKEGALKIAPGVEVIDTTGLTIKEVYDKILDRIRV
jgi:cytidylate kinase